MKRKTGFYWVLPNNATDWTIAQWDSALEDWTFTGIDSNFRDEDMEEIDERKIVRS